MTTQERSYIDALLAERQVLLDACHQALNAAKLDQWERAGSLRRNAWDALLSATSKERFAVIARHAAAMAIGEPTEQPDEHPGLDPFDSDEPDCRGGVALNPALRPG